MQAIDHYDLAQLTESLATADGVAGVLQQLAGELQHAVSADAVYIERCMDHGGVEVVASTGSAAPHIGARPPYQDLLTTIAQRIPIEGERGALGMILVVQSGPQLQPARPEAVERVALIVNLTRLALQMSVLYDEARYSREQLERMVDEKFRLLSGITYELNDQLGIAAEYVQLLDTEGELSERQIGYISSSRKAILSSARLIGDLLELARVEAGRLPIQLEPTSVGAILRDMASDYRLASGTYGFTLTLEIADELPAVVTDPDHVKKILDNLFSNAVRYTPANGAIVVRASTRAGRRHGDPARWVCVSICDSGPGVLDEQGIFEAVSRVGKTRGSAGFRLAINRHIARRIGGDLTVENGDEGGACFTLWLPQEI